KAIAGIFGTKAERDMKELLPYVDQINAEFSKLKNISDEELRAASSGVQQTIEKELKSIDDELKNLHQQIEENPLLDLNRKEEIFSRIDKLEADRDKQLEVVLMKVLPQAFAIVKETARRFKENGKLSVSA